MSRYFTRSEPTKTEWYWSDAAPLRIPYPTTFPEEPVNTGILDPNGKKIYRGPDAVGFVRFRRDR